MDDEARSMSRLAVVGGDDHRPLLAGVGELPGVDRGHDVPDVLVDVAQRLGVLRCSGASEFVPGFVNPDEIGELEVRRARGGVENRVDGGRADRVIGVQPTVVDLRVVEDGVGGNRTGA